MSIASTGGAGAGVELTGAASVLGASGILGTGLGFRTAFFALRFFAAIAASRRARRAGPAVSDQVFRGGVTTVVLTVASSFFGASFDGVGVRTGVDCFPPIGHPLLCGVKQRSAAVVRPTAGSC